MDKIVLKLLLFLIFLIACHQTYTTSFQKCHGVDQCGLEKYSPLSFLSKQRAFPEKLYVRASFTCTLYVKNFEE
jgi:hypothetical protein